MRELGVLSAFGVQLGPMPPGPAPSPPTPAEKRQARIEAARQDVRDKLAGTGREYTDEQLDAFIDPAVFSDG